MKGELTHNLFSPQIHRVLRATGFVLPMSTAFLFEKMKSRGLLTCSVVFNHGQTPYGLLGRFPDQMLLQMSTAVVHGLPAPHFRARLSVHQD